MQLKTTSLQKRDEYPGEIVHRTLGCKNGATESGGEGRADVASDEELRNKELTQGSSCVFQVITQKPSFTVPHFQMFVIFNRYRVDVRKDRTRVEKK